MQKDKNPLSHGLDGTENVSDWYYARTQQRRLRHFYNFALTPVIAGLTALHAEQELASVGTED